MAKDRNIKYADYDYGQPEAEKNGLLIRSKDGDHRVSMFAAAFVIIPLIIGGLFSIPSIRDYLDGRQNLAEIAIGRDFFEIDACLDGKEIDLAALHQAESLDRATAVEITITQQNRSKGTVATMSEVVSLDGMDITQLPTDLPLQLSLSDFEIVAPNSRAWQCAYTIDIVK